MIKIKIITGDKKKRYLNDNRKSLEACLNEIVMTFREKNKVFEIKENKLFKYLEYDGEKYSEEKLIDLLIGNKDKLETIINNVGIINDSTTQACFNKLYKNFTKRKLGKEWAKIIGVDICPYCNRMFTDTIIDGSIRPQYDHYFIKSDYPYLAVSMYNLVPCCPICNLKKGTYDTYKNKFIYPFEEEYGDKVYFKVKERDIFYSIFDSNERNVKLELICNNEDLSQKVDNTNKQLKILELYENRSSFINRLLYLKHNIYVDEYIDSLKKIEGFNGLTSSDFDYLIYGKYLEKENWDKDILAKLAHDIIKME